MQHSFQSYIAILIVLFWFVGKQNNSKAQEISKHCRKIIDYIFILVMLPLIVKFWGKFYFYIISDLQKSFKTSIKNLFYSNSLIVHLCCNVLPYPTLGIEPRTSGIVGQPSTPEPQASLYLLCRRGYPVFIYCLKSSHGHHALTQNT